MSEPTRSPQPIILIRGFGGLDVSDEKKDTYQRFNVGTVYPQKQGENYIYEGLILRFMKSNWKYQDTTNVVGYYGKTYAYEPLLPEKLKRSTDKDIVEKFMRLKELGYFSGNKIIIDPGMALHLLETVEQPWQTLWVFRYYDLDERKFNVYGEALVRLIDFIRELTVQKEGFKPKVNIIAHSMGGLIAREAVQRTYPTSKQQKAENYINKIVTLGTPHQGISFQILKNWINISAEDELKHFNPDFQKDPRNDAAFVNFHNYFPAERLLTVVGTNYRSYDAAIASRLNRAFSLEGEYGANYNRSDGLVKQTSAQIPGTPRTFVHKCHGGDDSLITSREAFEVATRFFFGNLRSRLRLVKGKVTRGKDFFGKSEFFLGVSIKPRGVDFELFHQSKDAENCYGPFSQVDPLDKNVNFSEANQSLGFPWADNNKLIWQGYLDTKKSLTAKDMVLRVEFYIGERDLYGFGFSDNKIFNKQYYVRALLPTTLQPNLKLYLHADEQFMREGFQPSPQEEMQKVNGGWQFDVRETGFEGTFRIELDRIPENGLPIPFV
ncbi:alpha/beta hydrolase [Trichocoleus sp. DQ-A3]|uniref:esterase/lipase family protein n=1 Tax=Cyanophyceae TaxID=3028117 RepID=UPI001682291F|nr:alpha/beta hydrolase [Coleofasciculus sp. FACHB-125]MBD1903036.1 alpha/beta hydrolase [Coleofasciculus sp. FACHB-125]